MPFLCMVISKGDTVRLIDEPGQGKVLSIDGNEATLSIDGMEMSYPLSSLVKVEFDDLVKPETIQSNRTVQRKLNIDARNKLKKIRPVIQATYELDLHMHELLDRFDHMSKAQMLEYQMQRCRAFIHEARQKQYKKVVLIHGVGEGVLRAEIHNWLDSLDKVSYHDAPYRTYGYGATEVILWR